MQSGVGRANLAIPITKILLLPRNFGSREEVNGSLADAQQVLLLAKVALEAKAPGNLKSRDHTSLDGLAALSGPFTRCRYFASAGFFVCRRKSYAVAAFI